MNHNSYMLSVVVSPDGTCVATGGGNEVFVSDAESGHLISGPMKGHNSWVNWLCFSPDGKRLASGSDDRTVIIWDMATGKMLVPPSPFQAHFGQVRSVSFSPDGKRIMTASNDNTIQIWDADTGRPFEPGLTLPITGHQNGVTCALWSRDGNQIISCSFDGMIGFWDSNTGEQIGDFCQGHTAPIWSIDIAPNGRYLASASFDGTARMWDVVTHKQIGPPLEHGSEVYCATFSPDGLSIISGGHDSSGRVFLWDVREIVHNYFNDNDSGAHTTQISNQPADSLGKAQDEESVEDNTVLKPEPGAAVFVESGATHSNTDVNESRPLPIPTPPIASPRSRKFWPQAWDKMSKIFRPRSRQSPQPQ